MLVRAYLPKFLTALFGGLFITAGILTFGNALVFDRIFIFVLIFTAIICRKDVNVLGIVLILSFERALEELFWYAADNTLLSKIFIYVSLSLLCYKFKFDAMAKIAAVILTLSISAECFWLISSHETPPEIYWYNIVIGQSLIIRFMLFSRISLTQRLLKKDGESINLDWSIYQITRLYIAFAAFNISEYLIRHLLNIDMTLIHQLYPYAMQTIATYTLWVLFYETNKIIGAKLIKA